MSNSERDIQASIEGHATRNAALLDDLRSRGVNPDRPHAVEHHFWAPDQPSAAQLAKALYELGYLVLVLSPTDEEDGSKTWNVEVGTQRTVTDAANGSVSEQLVRQAARFGGVYDGWGASV